MTTPPYGTALYVDKDPQDRPRLGVINAPEVSGKGNLVLRVGHTLDAGQWTQSEHVVLTPAEAHVFLNQCLALLPAPSTGPELMARMSAAFPLAELGEDNDCQLIINTGLTLDGTNVVPLAE